MKDTTQQQSQFPAIFNDFAAKLDTRYAIAEPFVCKDGRAYATDGRACVRSIRSDYEYVDLKSDSERVYPPADNIFKDTFGDNPLSIDMDSIRLILQSAPAITKQCTECDGDGAYDKCDECGGWGEVECLECGHTNDCRKCKGSGQIRDKEGGLIKCVDCGATGREHVCSLIQIGDYWFDAKYASLIFNDSFSVFSEEEGKMLYARGDDFEAVVMPRSFDPDSAFDQGKYGYWNGKQWVVPEEYKVESKEVKS